MYTEILKLKEMLENENIPFAFAPHFDGYLVHYPEMQDFDCSAIQFFGSYGHDQDLIEIMGLMQEGDESDIIGYLTAEEVFNRIKKHWEEHKEELKR